MRVIEREVSLPKKEQIIVWLDPAVVELLNIVYSSKETNPTLSNSRCVLCSGRTATFRTT